MKRTRALQTIEVDRDLLEWFRARAKRANQGVEIHIESAMMQYRDHAVRDERNPRPRQPDPTDDPTDDDPDDGFVRRLVDRSDFDPYHVES